MKLARGFSLVELMVAITLALIVTGGVLSVFIGSRSAFQATSGIATVSDNGRFALNFLEGAVRDAGNMACGSPFRTIVNLNPEPTPLNYAAGPGPSFLFQPMGGFEAAGTGVGATYNGTTAPGALVNWNPTLDAAFSSLATLPIKNNDILVVRSSAQGSEPGFVTAAAANSLTLVSVPATWAVSQLAVVSDCVKSLVFQISSKSGSTIYHDTGGTPGNLTSAFPGNVDFAAGSQVTLFQTTAYYIGVGADGDGALYSADLQADNSFPNPPTELVPGIEAMQILYGIDKNGTQTVGQYVTADQVIDFSTVMSVEIALLAAGPLGSANTPTPAKTYDLFGTTVTAPQDTRARQVFEVTIAARNLLP